MKRQLIVIILFIFLVAPDTAISAISSVVVSGQSITVSGGGFGTKATAAPIRFENFEKDDLGNPSGVGDEVSSEISYWSDRGDGYTNPIVAADVNRGISTREARTRQKVVNGVTTYDEMAWANDIPFGAGKILVSFWIYFQWDAYVEFQDDKTYYQVKTVSLGASIDSNGAAVLPPEWGMFNYRGNGPDTIFNTADDYTWSYFRNTSEGGGSRNLDNDTFPPTETGGWYLITMEINQGTPYTSDGSWKVYNTTPGMSAPIIVNGETNTQIKGTTDFGGFKFGWYINSADVYNAEVNLYYDDIYIDNSWSRVEIGDNAVYANCTHREIQPALTWSDTGITGTFNQGSFETGNTVYVFVVDENGVASDGYAVVLGSDPVVADPVVEILTASGQTVTASIFAVTGTATADTDQTISGVTCSGQTVTPDDGTWDEPEEDFTCLANLALGENTLVFVGSDGTRTGQDSITVTRIKKTSKINGSATIKNATIHQ